MNTSGEIVKINSVSEYQQVVDFACLCGAQITFDGVRKSTKKMSSLNHRCQIYKIFSVMECLLSINFKGIN